MGGDDLAVVVTGSQRMANLKRKKGGSALPLCSACSSCWVHYATIMKSLHIRDVPEQTIERLKRRASRHHRSLQGELQVLLEEAAKQVLHGDGSEFSLHTVRTQGNQDWSREVLYED